MRVEIIGIVCMALISIAALLLYFAYKFGGTREKMKRGQEKEKISARIRSIRCHLDDSDVIERLHNKFKR